MTPEDIKITSGLNEYQNAEFEQNDKMIDYEISKNLNYADIIAIYNGLNVISEFYDVSAAVTTTPTGICAVALGKELSEAVQCVIDSDPVDYINSVITLSKEVDSDLAKMFRDVHTVVAPSFTKNAVDYLEAHDVCYMTVKTPLKEYKKYISNTILQTPLGTITQGANLSELDKESFKVVTKIKPTVEQIEDAVFAWKVAKHVKTQATVIAKDLKTTAIMRGMQSASAEYALDYSCDRSKDAIMASDVPISLHDVNVAAQGRIALIIVPSASKEIIAAADKYNLSVITTGFTNILY